MRACGCRTQTLACAEQGGLDLKQVKVGGIREHDRALMFCTFKKAHKL
jgi:hypothetical protein